MPESNRDRSASNMMKAMRVLGLETGVKVERQANAIDAVEQAAMKILGFPSSNMNASSRETESDQLRGPDDDDDEDDYDNNNNNVVGSQRGGKSASPRVSSISKSRMSNGEENNNEENDGSKSLRSSHYSVWDGGDERDAIDNFSPVLDSFAAGSGSSGAGRPNANQIVGQSKLQDSSSKLRKSSNKHVQMPLEDDLLQRTAQSSSQQQKSPVKNDNENNTNNASRKDETSIGESVLSQLSVRDLQTLKRNNLFLSPDTAKVTVLVVDIALRQNEKNLLAPPFAVYLLRVRCGSRMWSVERRYREFASLHQSLQSVVSISRLPELPGKLAGFGGLMSSFFGPDIERLQQRRIELQAYFSMILRIKEIWHCDDLLMFLDDAKRTLSLQAHFARMVKMTEALAIETYNQNAQNRQLTSQLRVASSQVTETKARLNKLAMRLKEQLDEEGLSEAELNEKMESIMRRSHSSSSSRKDGEGSNGTSLTGSFSIGGPFSGIGSSFDLSSAFAGASDQLLALVNPINFSSQPTERISGGEVEGRQWSGKWELDARSTNTSFTGTEANIWGESGRLSSFATVTSTDNRKSIDGGARQDITALSADQLQTVSPEVAPIKSSSGVIGRTSSLCYDARRSKVPHPLQAIHLTVSDVAPGSPNGIQNTKQKIHAAMSKQSIQIGQASNKAALKSDLFNKSRSVTHRNSDLVSPASKQGLTAFENVLNSSFDEQVSNISAIDASGVTSEGSNVESPSPLKYKSSLKRVPTSEKQLVVSDRILTNEFDDVVSVVLGSIASERDRSNYFGDESSTTSTTFSRRHREKVKSPSTLSTGTPNKAVMYFPPSDASINAQSIMRAFLKLGTDFNSVSGDSSSFFDRLTVSPPGSVRSGTSTRSGKTKKKKQKPATVTFQPWSLELGLGLGGSSVVSHLSDTTRDSQRNRNQNNHLDPHDFTSERSGRSDEQQQRSGLSGLMIPPAGSIISISRNNNNIVATAATPDRQVISTTKRRRAYSESDVDALRRAIDQVVKVMKERAADSRAELESEVDRLRKEIVKEDEAAAAELVTFYTKEEEESVELLVNALGDANETRENSSSPDNNIQTARALIADSDVILAMVNPTRESNRVREEVAMFITNLLRNVAGLEVVPVGAVSSRVYLPDAPLEMSVVIPADMINFSLIPMLQRHLHTKNKNKGGSRQNGPISNSGGMRSDHQTQGINSFANTVIPEVPDQSTADPNVVLQEKLRKFALLGMSGERTWFVAANEALCKAAILSGVGRAGTHVQHSATTTSNTPPSSSNDASMNTAETSKDSGTFLKAGTSLSASIENLRMLYSLQFRASTASSAGSASEDSCANLETKLQQATEEMEKLIALLENKMKEANAFDAISGETENSSPASALSDPTPEPASPVLSTAISDARSLIKAASSLADISFTLQDSMASIMNLSSSVATSVAHQVLRQHTLYAHALRRFAGLVDLSDSEISGPGAGVESHAPLPMWMYNTRGEPFIMRNLTFSTGDLPWQVGDVVDPDVPFEDLFGGDDDDNFEEEEEEEEEEEDVATRDFFVKSSAAGGKLKKPAKLSPTEKSRKRKLRLLREAKQRMRDVVAAKEGSGSHEDEEDEEADEEVEVFDEIQNRRFARPSISCLVNNVRVIISAGQRQLHARYQRLPIVNVPVQSKVPLSKNSSSAGTHSTTATFTDISDTSGVSGDKQAPNTQTINSLQVMAALTAEAAANAHSATASAQEDLSLTVAVDCGTLGASLEIQRVISLENFATAIDHSTHVARIQNRRLVGNSDTTTTNKLVLSVPTSFTAVANASESNLVSNDRESSSGNALKVDSWRAPSGAGALLSDSSSTNCKVLTRDHIFKRTVLLILAWLRYESESALVRDSSQTIRPEMIDSMQSKSHALSASKLVSDSYVEPIGLIPQSRRSQQKASNVLQSSESTSFIDNMIGNTDAVNADDNHSVISYQSIEMMVIALFVEANNFAATESLKKNQSNKEDRFTSPALYTWRRYLPSRGFFSSPIEAAFSFCAVYSTLDFSRFVVCSSGIRPLRAFIELLRSESVLRELVASVGRLQAEVEAVALSAGVLNGEIVVRQQNHTLIAVREQHLQSIKQAQEQALSLLSQNSQRQEISNGLAGDAQVVIESKIVREGIEVSTSGNDLDAGADVAIAAAAAAAASGQSLGLGLPTVKTSSLPPLSDAAILPGPNGRQILSENSSKRVSTKIASMSDSSKNIESSGVTADIEDRGTGGDKDANEDDISVIQAATLRLFRKRGLLSKHIAALGRVGMVSQEGVRESSINRKQNQIDTQDASLLAPIPVLSPLPSPNVIISLDDKDEASNGRDCFGVVARAVQHVAEHNIDSCLSAAGATARNLGKKDNIAFYACAYLLEDPPLASNERDLSRGMVAQTPLGNSSAQEQSQQLPSHSAILSPSFFYNPLVTMATFPSEDKPVPHRSNDKSLMLARNVRVRGSLVAPTPGVVMHVTDFCLPHVNATAGVTSKGLLRLRGALAALCRRVVLLEKEKMDAEEATRSVEAGKQHRNSAPTRYRSARDLTLFPHVQEFLGGGQRIIGSFAAYRPDLLFHPFQNRGAVVSSMSSTKDTLFNAKGMVNSDVIARLLFLDYPSSIDVIPVETSTADTTTTISQQFSSLDAPYKESLQNAAFSDAISSRRWTVSSISAIFAKVISVRGCSQVSVAGKLVHELPGCGDVGALVRAFLGGLRRLFLRQASSIFHISNSQTLFPLSVCLREHLPLFPHVHVLPKKLLLLGERYQTKANTALQVLHTFTQKQQQQQKQQHEKQQQEMISASLDDSKTLSLISALRSYISEDLVEIFEAQLLKKSTVTRKAGGTQSVVEKNRPNEKDKDKDNSRTTSTITQQALDIDEGGVGGGDRVSLVSSRGGRGGRGGGRGGSSSGGGTGAVRGAASKGSEASNHSGGPNQQQGRAASTLNNNAGVISQHEYRDSSKRGGGRGGLSSSNVFIPSQGIHQYHSDRQFGHQQFVDPQIQQQQQQMMMAMMLMEQQRQLSASGSTGEFAQHGGMHLGYPTAMPGFVGASPGMSQFGAYDPQSAMLLQQQQQMMMYNEYLQQHHLATSQSHLHHQAAAATAPPQAPPVKLPSYVPASSTNHYPSGATIVNGVHVPVYTDAHGTKYVMVDNTNSEGFINGGGGGGTGEDPTSRVTSSNSAAAREEIKKRVREYGPRR